MGNWLRHFFKLLGLAPPLIDVFTNLTNQFKPLPPLEARASWAAGTMGLVAFLLALYSTRASDRPRGRFVIALLLSSLAVIDMLVYFWLVERYPGHSLLVDAFQVLLWGLFFGLVTGAVVLCVDGLALWLAGKKNGETLAREP